MMKIFLLRIFILIGLMGGFFISEGTIQSVPVLFTFSAILTLYFFLAVSKKPLMLYIIINFLVLTLFMYISGAENPFAFGMLLYFSVLAIMQLGQKEFNLFAIFNFIVYVFLAVLMNQWSMIIFISLLFFYSISIWANGLSDMRNEYQKMYEQLAGEYRTLKRQVVVTEEEARYEERTKIARDIHDSVGHKLTALLMQLEILALQHGEEKYKDLKELASESLEETRFAVRALKSGEQEGIGTILQLIKKLESESHILVHFTTKQGILSSRLTNDQSVVLYRVIQEGLTNAMRHAHSKEVHVVLGRTATNHIGFTIQNRIYHLEPFQEGFGLQNMRKRVEEIGGILSIYQTDEHFIIKGSLPAR